MNFSKANITTHVSFQHAFANLKVSGVQSSSDYYPFGSTLPGRGYDGATASYRFGFNGKENDNEVYGDGGFQDYGMRSYDTRICRFVSVDPITAKYPELTPYQFASNRPLDGLDIDGLEYYTYNINIVDGAIVSKKLTSDWTNATANTMNEIHKTNAFYTRHSKGYGPLGPGIHYKYTYTNSKSGVILYKDIFWDKSGVTDYGIYFGEGCPTNKGELFQHSSNNPYNYELPPIDMVDALAKQHDKNYDRADYKDGGWLNDPKTIPADEAFIVGLKQFVANSNNPNFIDPYTGRPPSGDAIYKANSAIAVFSIIVQYKRGIVSKNKAIEKIQNAQFPNSEKKATQGGTWGDVGNK